MTTPITRKGHGGHFLFALLVPLLALALMAPVQAQEPPDAPGTEEPEAGAGTAWLECREDAVENFDSCRLEAGQDFWDKYKCALAWDLDNIGCNVDLIEDLMPGGAA